MEWVDERYRMEISSLIEVLYTISYAPQKHRHHSKNNSALVAG